MSAARIAALLADSRLWTANDGAALATVPTGVPALDAELPGGGWPCGAITEVLHARAGIGELSMLAPALAQLSGAGRRIALVSPPYLACAQGWMQLGVCLPQLLLIEAPSGRNASAHDALWCAEQALRSQAFGAVLLWPASIGERDLRRLQLAAEAGGAIGFLFRPPEAARHASPAALRLLLSPDGRLDILKSRGGRPRSLALKQNHALAVPPSAAPAARCAG